MLKTASLTLVFLLLMSAVSALPAAELYRTNQLEQIIDPPPWGPYIHKINDHSFIFIGNLGGNKGLFRHDVGQGKTVFLKSIDYPNYQFYVDFASHGNKTLIDINGKLLVTDGSASGTSLIKDFGTSYSVSNGDPTSRVCSINYLHGAFYLTVGSCEVGNSDDLWITSGTLASTRLLSEDKHKRIISVFDDQTKPDNSILFLAVNLNSRAALWQISGESGAISMLSEFADKDLSAETRSPVKTAKGVFSCLYDRSTGSRAIWRVSNGRAVDHVIDDCLSLIELNDELYFTSSGRHQPAGLWATSGNVGNKQLLKKFLTSDVSGNVDAAHIVPGRSCAFDGNLYFSVEYGRTARQVWRSDGTRQGTENAFPGQNLRIEHCFESRMALSSDTQSLIYHFDPNKLIPVRGSPNHIYNTYGFEINDAIIAANRISTRLGIKDNTDIDIVSLVLSDNVYLAPIVSTLLEEN